MPVIRIIFVLAISFITSLGVMANEPVTNAAEEGITNKASEAIQQYTSEQALTISQAAIGQTVGHYQFTTSSGQKVSLKNYLGKPVIISLVYTSCYNICPTTTENLNKVVEKAKDVLGNDSFNVLTVGFDTQVDTPDMMAQFASAHSSKSDNWHFLSSDPATMSAFVRDLGFIYFASPNGFDHMIQATILDRNGKVYRQVYGLQPQTPHFVEPIKELVFGTPKDDSFFASLTAQINLFCTVYDPALDRYYFNYSVFVGVFVGFVLGIYFLRLFLREWRYTKSKMQENQSD